MSRVGSRGGPGQPMEPQQTAEGRPPMTERAMHVEILRARIERDDYAVDPRAVADAIVALLLARQNACS